jgi:hypothetical protein
MPASPSCPPPGRSAGALERGPAGRRACSCCGLETYPARTRARAGGRRTGRGQADLCLDCPGHAELGQRLMRGAERADSGRFAVGLFKMSALRSWTSSARGAGLVDHRRFRGLAGGTPAWARVLPRPFPAQLRDQSGGLRTPRPRQDPALRRPEELSTIKPAMPVDRLAVVSSERCRKKAHGVVFKACTVDSSDPEVSWLHH